MAGSAEIRAGGAFVELFTKNGGLKKGLDQAAKDLKSFGAGVATLGGGVAAVGGTMLAPIAAGFADLMEYAAQLRGLSARTGESIENLSLLGYAAGTTGISLEELGAMSKHLSKHLDEAKEKGGEAAAAFERLGLNVHALAGMGFEDQVLAISDQFAKLTNDVERNALAQKLFGKSGDDTLAFLRKGSAGIRQLMEDGRAMGALLTGADAAALKEFSLGLKQLQNTGRFAFMELGKALIPALGDMNALNKKVRELVGGARLWVQNNGQLIITVFKLATVMVAAGTGIVILGGLISGLGTVLGLAGAAAAWFWGVLLSPAGAILALAAVVGYLWSQTEGGSGFISRVAADWQSSWGAIVAAVKAGDLEGAFSIVVLNLKVMWLDWAETVESQIDKLFGTDIPAAADVAMNKTTGSIQAGTKEWDAAMKRGAMSFTGMITIIWTGLQTIWAFVETLGEAIARLWRGESMKGLMADLSKELDRIRKEGQTTLVNLDENKIAHARGHLPTAAERARQERDEKVKNVRDAAKPGPPPGGKPPPGAALAAMLPAIAAGTFSGYAVGQTLALSDKIGERIAEGIDKIAENTDPKNQPAPGVHQ